MNGTEMLKGLVTAGAMGLSGLAFAGRPLTIDDADPVDVGQLEFEVGAAHDRDADCKHWDLPLGLTYGAVHNVQVGVGFGGQLEERTELLGDGVSERCNREHGIGDLTMGLKWQFLESCPFGARHALVPSVKFPTAEDDKGLGSGQTDCDLTWVASRSMGERACTHVNLGYSWIGGLDDDVLHYGVALDYGMMESVQWVGEVFAEQTTSSDADPIVQYNAGFRWNPLETLTLDIAGGSKLTDDAPDFTATAGLTWVLGFGNSGSKQGK